MESFASSSGNPFYSYRHARFRPSQPISDRIVRAIRHRMLLLHRSGSTFFIFGATGNVYTVSLSCNPSCSCPDHTTPCKHILFVMIKVLGVPVRDPCLRRSTLHPCQVQCLLDKPTLPESVAGDTLKQRFHELFFNGRQGNKDAGIEIEDGATCPVCLEEMEKGEKVVACRTCRNPIHEDCLVRWKKSRGRRMVSCVMCRARWRDKVEQDKYLNLSAFASGNDMADSDGSVCNG